MQELSEEGENTEKINKTLETIQVRLPRYIQAFTSLIPALFASVLQSGKVCISFHRVSRSVVLCGWPLSCALFNVFTGR